MAAQLLPWREGRTHATSLDHIGVVVVFGFAVRGWFGTCIYQERSPIPERVVTTEGREVVGPGEIMRGRSCGTAKGFTI